MNRISKDEYYLNIALDVSKRSTCLRRHYGCVIVNNDEIVATGYNGSPRGCENCCDRGKCKRENAERYHGYEECDSVHAEQNALISAGRNRCIGGTIYLACETLKELKFPYAAVEYEWVEDKNPVPCNICEKMIRNSGIRRVANKSGEVLCL